jgi:hypothetical protein
MRILLLTMLIAHGSFSRLRVDSIDQANALEQVLPHLQGFVPREDTFRNIVQVLAENDEKVAQAYAYLMDNHFSNVEDLIQDWLLLSTKELDALFRFGPLSFRSLYSVDPSLMPEYTLITVSFLKYAADMSKCYFSILPLGLRLSYDDHFRHLSSAEYAALGTENPVLVDSARGCVAEHVYRSVRNPRRKVLFTYLSGSKVALEVVDSCAWLWFAGERGYTEWMGGIVRGDLYSSRSLDSFYLLLTRLMPNLEAFDFVYVFPDLSHPRLVGHLVVIRDNSAIDIMGDSRYIDL